MIFDPVVIVKGSSRYNMPLEVTAEPGAVITAFNSAEVVEAIVNESGKAMIALPAAGTYEVYATLGDKRTASKLVEAPSGLSTAFSFASRLPEGYTELEYINNGAIADGTKYKASGYSIKIKDLRIEVDAELLQAASGYPAPILGYYNKVSSTSHHCVGLFFGSTGTSYAGLWAQLATSGSSTIANKLRIQQGSEPRRVHVVWDIPNKTITVDGVVVTTNMYTYSSITTASSFTLNFFQRTDLYGASATDGWTRIYNFKVYHGDSLDRDWVPARNEATGKDGFYDLVSGTFVSLANSTTGIGGPEV